ncbi:MAG: DUF4230 domain-containing protein [Pseudobutyrivibrio ruminis]|uniref:DUF4230 domain-containing protein n=1 Tax=Pseudobutyrivibrio ruminis TaxID=46206 RepID=A0A927YP63_9FIRM|nr:DUF4230 domain-containing protein [Pseudobutyrivibrio ruminis]
MKKIIVLRIIIVLLIILTIATIVIFKDNKSGIISGYDDGIEQVDPNTIILSDSGVRVSFSDVILSKPEETRKLVVYEQEGTVSYKIEDRTLDFLDWEPAKKYQTVKYNGKGSFVVELDQLTQENIIDDKENKILTIKIPHPHLDTIEIDPANVEIGSQSSGFFTIGDIKLTVSDYNTIEKELRKRLKDKFDISSNGQEADDLAKKAVYEIYNPVVQAVDSDYELVIDFQ